MITIEQLSIFDLPVLFCGVELHNRPYEVEDSHERVPVFLKGDHICDIRLINIIPNGSLTYYSRWSRSGSVHKMLVPPDQENFINEDLESVVEDYLR